MSAAIFLGILFFGFLGGMVFLRWREERFLKKKTKEALGKGLRREIDQERQDAERRKKRFEDQLKKFSS